MNLLQKQSTQAAFAFFLTVRDLGGDGAKIPIFPFLLRNFYEKLLGFFAVKGLQKRRMMV